MKLLVVSPDYMSHSLPLIQIGRAWLRLQGDVVVATGTATQPLVEAAGLQWAELRLGRGRNDGVIEVDRQPAGEDAHLRAFFDSTRVGPIATLLYQTEARRHDLLHEPDRVLDRMMQIIGHVQPDRVVVDHVAFGARLALHALGVEGATVVLGHPSALPAPGEAFGLPPAWPRSMQPPPVELAKLTRRCHSSVEELRVAAAELMHRRAPHRPAADDLPSASGQPTIYVYPEALHDPARALPHNHVFIGALTRTESAAAPMSGSIRRGESSPEYRAAAWAGSSLGISLRTPAGTGAIWKWRTALRR